MKKVVVLSGAGISAESGIKTFRDHGGLWEGYRIDQVATPEAWRRDPQLVLDFYNERRRALLGASPNTAHLAIVELEREYEVCVITQNVDDLHERAGSSRVLHLHGELTKSRSTRHPELVYSIDGPDLLMGQTCERGSQLRPHIVWFGEAVPELENAARIVRQADVVIVVGSSLVVYPAAGLILEAPRGAKKYVVDPKKPELPESLELTFIEEKATTGVRRVVDSLLCR